MHFFIVRQFLIQFVRWKKIFHKFWETHVTENKGEQTLLKFHIQKNFLI